jgi:hypothetical protein
VEVVKNELDFFLAESEAWNAAAFNPSAYLLRFNSIGYIPTITLNR